MNTPAADSEQRETSSYGVQEARIQEPEENALPDVLAVIPLFWLLASGYQELLTSRLIHNLSDYHRVSGNFHDTLQVFEVAVYALQGAICEE